MNIIEILEEISKENCKCDKTSIIKELINTSIQSCRYISKKAVFNDKTILLAYSAIFNYLAVPKDDLFKVLTENELNQYISSINYLESFIKKIKIINPDDIIKDYKKYHTKPFEEMTKEELLLYIKNNK